MATEIHVTISVAGNEILYRDEAGNLLIYNVTSRKPRKILDSSNNVSITCFSSVLLSTVNRKYLYLSKK